MVLLHGFGKKSQHTPPADPVKVRRTLAQLQSERPTKKKHVGRGFGDFLRQDRRLDPDNPSVTIGTLERAATALNRRLTVGMC